MKEIFSYENKVVQLLMKIADMAMLNVLYILCCIPIFTIGAAQAGLYGGIRQLMNKDDDTSCFRAYFRAFRSGFKQITLAYLVYLLAMVLLCVLLMWVQFWSYAGFGGAPIWMCLAVMGILAVFWSVLGPFHASFSCSTGQLIRNLFFITMAYPLQSILSGVVLYMPVILLLVDIYSFLELTVLWLLLYYAMAFLLIHLLMKGPMEELKRNYLSAEQADVQ